MTQASAGVAVLMSAVLLFSLQGAAQSPHWPSFRGPGATGVAAGVPPTAWNATSGVRWSVPLRGLSHASPTVWNGVAYAISAVALEGTSRLDTSEAAANGVIFATDTVPHAWRMTAVDVASGRVLWDRELHRATPGHARHVRGSYANATPAANGEVIVATLGLEGLFAFEMDGRLRWRQPIRPASAAQALDPAASPVIAGDRAIVQADWQQDGFIAAHALADGREIWRRSRAEGMTWATPTVVSHASGPVVVANSPRWIRAYAVETGDEVWRLNNTVAQPWDRAVTPFEAGDLTIVAGGGGERPLFAIARDARGDITPAEDRPRPSGLAWIAERGSPYLPTPVAHAGILYVLANNGVLTARDLTTGAEIYRQRVAVGHIFSASPIVAGGHLYCSTEDGQTFVIRAGREYALVSRNALDEPIFATPAVAGNTLLIRTASRLVAIGR